MAIHIVLNHNVQKLGLFHRYLKYEVVNNWCLNFLTSGLMGKNQNVCMNYKKVH